MRVEHRSGKMDWRTPPWFLDLVREVLGRIACDPATAADNPTCAEVFYTEEDDGLSKQWAAQWYCNPPYGRTLARWADAVAEAPRNGVLLVPSRTDTKWFRTVWRPASAVCFINGRIVFEGAKDGAPFPSAVFYYGANPELFRDVFRPYGIVVVKEAE